ncbi:MAG: hypothetical protein LBO08_00495 [Rickettsiales bacterium]|jgi:hypothetical protein|nr:hypothetical protein [Rickettsiales bacterium]
MRIFCMAALAACFALPAVSASRPGVAPDAAAQGSAAVARRGGTMPMAVSDGGANAARAGALRATPNAPAAPTVVARAGATQKVVGTGVKVNAAVQNSVVGGECREKYFGCMDSFCMIENDNGGRCICSSRKSELDKVLAEIEKLDDQTFKLATKGVEKIEMGANADYIFKTAEAAEKDALGESELEKNKNKIRPTKKLDMSMWTAYEVEELEIPSDGISDKSGNARLVAAHDLCQRSIGNDCSVQDFNMVQTMYQTNVQSDCRAYENYLKQKKNESSQKLSTAQSAVREAALASFENANKYNLGECSIEMKKCMAKTAGCKDDFTGCVGLAAAENIKRGKAKTYDIKGTTTKVTINASTYDTMLAKKPLCFDTVVSQCIAVRDQVWDVFLRDIAPTLKSAELVAESDLRMNCISNISNCFQKACKDNMDPANPEGSYDMCLSRPQTLESVCKIQIDPCKQAEPQILNFVKARVAAMRVDACTTQVKNCYTADTVCGKNFENCIGLDRDAIIDMCPAEKLTACVHTNGNPVKAGDKISTITGLTDMIQGIYLSIDNAALAQCQKIANDKMIEICGDTASCGAFSDDSTMGTDSLYAAKNSSGNYVISGLMNFGSITTAKDNQTNDDGRVQFASEKLSYTTCATDTAAKNRIEASFNTIKNKTDNLISMLSSDTQLGYCLNGRSMRQISGADSMTATARFPNLIDTYMKVILDAGLTKASENYDKKLKELATKATENQSDDMNAAMCAAMASDRDNLINVFSGTGGNDKSDSNSGFCGTASITISGARLTDLAKAVSGADKEILLLGTKGEMIAKQQYTSIYSRESNTCKIKTTTIACKSTEAQYDTSSSCGSGGITLIGSACGGGLLKIGGSKKTSTRTFAGVICKEFEAPIESEQTIAM